MSCPCGSGRTLEGCCGAYHRGAAPPTAEALMRSRYSAFAVGDVEYLLATGSDQDRAGIEHAVKQARFVGLRVESTERGLASDDEGYVTFAARLLDGGRLIELGERSHFVRKEGRWQYEGGDTEVRELELGRNDLCPCGSGKKAKRCHLA